MGHSNQIPVFFNDVWVSEEEENRKTCGYVIASSTILTASKKLRGMRNPVGDDKISMGVFPHNGDDHDRYRQLSTASRQTSPARAAR